MIEVFLVYWWNQDHVEVRNSSYRQDEVASTRTRMNCCCFFVFFCMYNNHHQNIIIMWRCCSRVTTSRNIIIIYIIIICDDEKFSFVEMTLFHLITVTSFLLLLFIIINLLIVERVVSTCEMMIYKYHPLLLFVLFKSYSFSETAFWPFFIAAIIKWWFIVRSLFYFVHKYIYWRQGWVVCARKGDTY